MNINTTQMPGGSFWGGSPATVGQVNRFGQQQQGGMSEILRMALSGISGDAGKQFDFAPIAQKARSQFQQNTLPSLAERFTSMGSGSSLGSPAFANQFSQAGAGLEEGLASQEAGFGAQQHQQQQQMLMQLLGLGMQPQNETFFSPRSPGFAESSLQGLMGAIPKALALYFGGGI